MLILSIYYRPRIRAKTGSGPILGHKEVWDHLVVQNGVISNSIPSGTSLQWGSVPTYISFLAFLTIIIKLIYNFTI